MTPTIKSYSIIGLLVMLFLTSCTSQKNTAGTRRWKSFKARYNTYFNGHQAYLEGMRTKTEGNKDNYTGVIPLLMVSNKTSQSLGSSNFETTITKCEKTIKLYSIKAKPETKRGHRLTPAEKAYRNRKEFNPFIKNAWILMGKAQMEKGDFIEAASTFAYTERLYQSQPKIANIARSLLALCYTELEWYYDAEVLLSKVRRDSIPHTARKPYNTAMTNWYLRQKQWKEALPYLRQEIKNMPRGIPRARGYFLLGQLCQQLDLRQEGYEALQKCMRQAPPYELKFNAQILQTEVMPQGNFQKKIAKLRRMAKSPNNKNYLDQVYYAMGNVYLALPDTAKAIEAYETGSRQTSKNNLSKATLMLSLGDLYWAKERFDKAQRCYSAAASGLGKEHERSEELQQRNKILTQLVPPAKEIFVQDSLQALALMPEKERNAVIDKVIEYVKLKQKNERRAKNDSLARGQRNRRATGNNQLSAGQSPQDKSGTWYFYNQQTVEQGKLQFQRLWGERPNEDNWRRSDKESAPRQGSDDIDYEKEDTTATTPDNRKQDDKKAGKTKKQEADSLDQGPLSRAYYLAQLPFTDEQKAESNRKLSQALFKAGVIEKDMMDNYALSRKTLMRLYSHFPDFKQRDELLYHLYLLELHWGTRESADAYKKELAATFPDSPFAKLITNPDFEENARYGTQIEDSVYARTYEAYRNDDFATMEQGCRLSESKYPKGANRAKFIFLNAMYQLHKGNIKGFAQNLRDIVKDHREDPISELAGGIVKNIEAGKVPAEGSFDLASLWAARGSAAAVDSTIQKDTLEADRYTEYQVILTYSKDSVNEGKLLYDVSRFNFTNYNVRNFDIEIVQAEDGAEMHLKGFTGFDEAHRYQQELYSDSACRPTLVHVTPLLISEHNLKLIGIKYTMGEYKAFYQKHFVPSKVKEDLKIDQQPDNFIWDEFQEVPEKKEKEPEDDIPVEDDGGEWY